MVIMLVGLEKKQDDFITSNKFLVFRLEKPFLTINALKHTENVSQEVRNVVKDISLALFNNNCINPNNESPTIQERKC